LCGITGARRPAPANADPFVHPDAQRRFRLLTDVEERERALEYPWEKWTVFLHPAQRQFVERDYNGPARISGSAGTGKTIIVGLHRAVLPARRHPSARILLTTFSSTLANALRVKLDRLAGSDTEVRRPPTADRRERPTPDITLRAVVNRGTPHSGRSRARVYRKRIPQRSFRARSSSQTMQPAPGPTPRIFLTRVNNSTERLNRTD